MAGNAPIAAASDRSRWPTAVSLRWLGVAGWELEFGGHRILVDPYLSRFRYATATGAIDPALPLAVSPSEIEAVVRGQLAGPPELLLMTHSHFDHQADAPYLLRRGVPETGDGVVGDQSEQEWGATTIRTICTETSWHLLTAAGLPGRRDVIVASGGEELRFDGYTVQVFRSLHSQYATYGYFAPGTLTAPPAVPPATLGDLIEGGTLAYQVAVDGGPTIMFCSGASNLAERELAGERPDILVLSISGYQSVHRYIERVMTVLGNPRFVVPSHHDDMTTPLSVGSAALRATVNWPAVERLVSTLRQVSPGSAVVPPEHLRPLRW